MTRLRQQLLRRVRLLLTVWLLALAWAPVAGAAEVPSYAHVVQIAAPRPTPSAPMASVGAPRVGVATPVAAPRCDLFARPSCARWARGSAHGPSFDGQSLYLELCTLLR